MQANLDKDTTIDLKIFHASMQETVFGKNYLTVFQFILKLAKCEPRAVLAQLESRQVSS